MSEPTPELIRATLARVLAGETLSKSAANRRLLTYLADRALHGGDGPKEIEIAIDVFSAGIRCTEGRLPADRFAARCPADRWNPCSRAASPVTRRRGRQLEMGSSGRGCVVARVACGQRLALEQPLAG